MSALLNCSIKRTARAAIAASILSIASVATAAEDPHAVANLERTANQTGVVPPLLQPIPPTVNVAQQEFEIDPGKVTMERLQNGTRLYHMNGQGMQSIVAHRGADGKIVLTCTDKVEQIVHGAEKSGHEQ